MEIKPIAHIRTDFKEKFGIPRQSRRAESLMGKIIFEKEFSSPEAIRGLEEISHLWLIFEFTEAKYKEGTMTVRPPRLGGNKRVGVFASRSPFRPNSLGLSCVKIEKIENGEITVSGVDILDGTPIYDIKPYIPYCDAVFDAQGSFAEENKEHHLEIDVSEELLNLIPEEKRQALIECLSDDPRPSYQDDDREYIMLFSGYDIHFKINENILTVTSIEKKSNG